VLQIQAAIVGAVSYLAEPHRRLVCEEDLIDMSKQRRTYSASCPAPGRAWMRCAAPGMDAMRRAGHGCDAPRRAWMRLDAMRAGTRRAAASCSPIV
jgi:hypothetical protein